MEIAFQFQDEKLDVNSLCLADSEIFRSMHKDLGNCIFEDEFIQIPFELRIFQLYLRLDQPVTDKFAEEFISDIPTDLRTQTLIELLFFIDYLDSAPQLSRIMRLLCYHSSKACATDLAAWSPLIDNDHYAQMYISTFRELGFTIRILVHDTGCYVPLKYTPYHICEAIVNRHPINFPINHLLFEICTKTDVKERNGAIDLHGTTYVKCTGYLVFLEAKLNKYFLFEDMALIRVLLNGDCPEFTNRKFKLFKGWILADRKKLIETWVVFRTVRLILENFPKQTKFLDFLLKNNIYLDIPDITINLKLIRSPFIIDSIKMKANMYDHNPNHMQFQRGWLSNKDPLTNPIGVNTMICLLQNHVTIRNIQSLISLLEYFSQLDPLTSDILYGIKIILKRYLEFDNDIIYQLLDRMIRRDVSTIEKQMFDQLILDTIAQIRRNIGLARKTRIFNLFRSESEPKPSTSLGGILIRSCVNVEDFNLKIRIIKQLNKRKSLDDGISMTDLISYLN